MNPAEVALAQLDAILDEQPAAGKREQFFREQDWSGLNSLMLDCQML